MPSPIRYVSTTVRVTNNKSDFIKLRIPPHFPAGSLAPQRVLFIWIWGPTLQMDPSFPELVSAPSFGKAATKFTGPLCRGFQAQGTHFASFLWGHFA